MRLSTEEGPDRQVETRAELERALAAWGDAEDAFVVLERAEEEFVQAAGTRAEGFIVEHRERADVVPSARGDLSKAEVLAVLGDYLEGKAWKARIQWKPEEAIIMPGRRRKGLSLEGVGGVFAFFGLFLAVAGGWKGLEAEAIRAHGASAQGTVLSTEVHRGKRGTTTTAIIEFDAGSDRVMLSESVPKGTRPGQVMTVYYDVLDPRRYASIDPPAEGVRSYRGLVGIGLVVLGFGAGLIAVGARARRRVQADGAAVRRAASAR